jgi:hypothetical protein
MREELEERAYAEVLVKICNNDSLRTQLIADGYGWEVVAPWKTTTGLASHTAHTLNMEGWWYLIYRTPSGIGAQLVIRFFREYWLRVEVTPEQVDGAGNVTASAVCRDMTPAERDAYLLANGSPGNPAVPDELVRVEFINFLRNLQADWFDQSWGSIAAGDIGPWPKTGGGED